MTPLILSALIVSVSGHGLMTSPAPRAGTNRAGNNKGSAGTTAPCGRGTAMNTAATPAAAATFTAGQTVTVQTNYPIPHGGTCRISLAEQGATVSQNGAAQLDAQGRLTAGTGVYDLTGDFACGRTNDNKEITIPAAASCTNCVLQWFWDGDSNYYNCADVAITPQQVAPNPAPAPAPNPTPANPVPNPAPANPVPNPAPANPANPNPVAGPTPANPANPNPVQGPAPATPTQCSEADEIAGLCGQGGGQPQLPDQNGMVPTFAPRMGGYGGGMGVVAGAHWTCVSMPFLALAVALVCS